jgi:hypothetical protein
MAKTQHVKLKGPLFEANWDKEIPVYVEGVLLRTGESVVSMMKKNTEPYDFRGTLTKSLMWKTSKRSSVPGTSFEIDAPKSNMEVNVGSAAPHAWYREYGAGPHRTKKDAALFIANMKAWFKQKVGKDPNDKDEGQDHFWAIVNTIRKGPKAQAREQGKHPFLSPVKDQFPSLLVTIAEAMYAKMMARLERKYKA